MFVNNGNNKLQFSRAEFINQMIKIVIFLIAGMGVYFSTIGDMKTASAVTQQKLSTVERLSKDNTRMINENAKAISELTRIVDRHVGHKP